MRQLREQHVATIQGIASVKFAQERAQVEALAQHVREALNKMRSQSLNVKFRRSMSIRRESSS